VILSVLESADEYLSAEEVYMAVYADHPGVGIATVYRTLQMLAEIGIAERVDTGDGKARYKLGPDQDHRRRVVLVCTNCSRTTPIAALTDDTKSVIAQIERMTADQHGFRSSRSVIQFYGLCEQCDKH
jgi:Fur family ferric uptake transcriptional regulator